MTDTIIKPKASFREVHEWLDNEIAFAQKEIDVEAFKDKARVLRNFGFENSIACLVYKSLSESQERIKEVTERYHGLYRFVIDEQVERICERYDLFVRNTRDYIGDIPEKAINDMKNLKIYFDDLRDEAFTPIINLLASKHREYAFGIKDARIYAEKAVCDLLIDGTRSKQINISERGSNFYSELYIAAPKASFREEAFTEGKTKRVEWAQHEAESKAQVDLDPIVLFRIKGGCLVVTAWGDEANDELIANPKMN